MQDSRESSNSSLSCVSLSTPLNTGGPERFGNLLKAAQLEVGEVGPEPCFEFLFLRIYKEE